MNKTILLTTAILEIITARSGVFLYIFLNYLAFKFLISGLREIKNRKMVNERYQLAKLKYYSNQIKANFQI